MKAIFDIGANKGQNLNYFLEKADIVIAVEANKDLANKIKSDFKQFLDNERLIVENIALTDDENLRNIDFYVSKVNDVLSTLYPDDLNKFKRQRVRSEKASSLINKYLKKYNITEIEYIKIDIESADKVILEDLLKNNILAKNLSLECHEPEVLKLLLNSPYKSFKFVEGDDLSLKKDIEVITKFTKKKIINFDKDASGPYGDDIPGVYYDKKSILPYFFNNGLGWKDIHCSLASCHTDNIKFIEKKYEKKILNSLGFTYHLKNLIPTFLMAIKRRIRKNN